MIIRVSLRKMCRFYPFILLFPIWIRRKVVRKYLFIRFEIYGHNDHMRDRNCVILRRSGHDAITRLADVSNKMINNAIKRQLGVVLSFARD